MTAPGRPRPEPQVVELPTLMLAGTRYEGDNQHGEIPAMWDHEFLPRMIELEEVRKGADAYGVARALPGPWTGVFEYLAAVEVDSFAELPEGMVGWEIPAGTYAMVPADNVPDLGAAEEYVGREWLPAHPEYAQGQGPLIERYPPTYASDGIIYVYLSIARR